MKKVNIYQFIFITILTNGVIIKINSYTRKYFVNISEKKKKLLIIIVYIKIIRILHYFQNVRTIRYIAGSGKEIRKRRANGL